MKEQVIIEINKAGFNTTSGIYSSLVDIVLDAIETVKTFGFDHWESQTTTGAKIKAIVKQLSA